MSLRNLATLAPAFTSSGRVLPSCWSSSAPSTCAGSMNWLSRPTARDWASARADWKRLVSLSIRIGALHGAPAPPVQGPITSSLLGAARRRQEFVRQIAARGAAARGEPGRHSGVAAHPGDVPLRADGGRERQSLTLEFGIRPVAVDDDDA